MTSQVFYRKWRPKTLADVVGQEHITQTLSNALAEDKVAHAYLFCGPRGTGKTSTGRILAKAVNCLNNGKGEPCNNCQICSAINEGRDLDLIEIDAASNTGVDDIRKLRDKVNYSPDIARYKVYIIDEVHMLSTSAFNALLKTLEEPPPHVIFILATTEVHKVLPTILSRCQRFDFRRIPQSAMVSRLEQICTAEDIHIEPAALGLIAKSAIGSLRDAENMLEQLTIHHGPTINTIQVQELLGITGDQRASELAKYILNKDTAAGLATINSVVSDGLDPRQFNKELVEYLRGILMVKVGAEKTLDVPDETIQEMKLLTQNSSAEDILKVIKLFGQITYRFDTQSTLPLELALIECTISNTQQTPSPVTTTKTEQASDIEHMPQPVTPAAVSPKIDITPPPAQTPAQTTQAIPATSTTPTTQTVADEHIELPLSNRTIEYFQQHWNSVIQALRGVGSTGNLDAFLRSACVPIDVEDDTIVLGFYYDFHKNRIEDPKYLHLVEKAVSRVFGGTYKLRCVLTPRDKKPEKQSVVEAALEMGAQIINDKPGENE